MHAQPSGRRHRPRLELLALVVFTLPGVDGSVVEANRRAVRDGPHRGGAGRQRPASATRRSARGLETLTVFERFCRAGGLSEGRNPPDRHQRDPRRRQPRAVHRTRRRSRPGLRSRCSRPRTRLSTATSPRSTPRPHRRRRARDRRREHAADPRRRTAARTSSTSFPLGAVRLTEELLPDEAPAKKKELSRVRDRVRETLGGLEWLARRAPSAPAAARRARRRGPQPGRGRAT